MGCTDEGNCCLILPLLSSQIYQAYINRNSAGFTGTLASVIDPINAGLTQLYQAIKCYQPINCQGLDTVLLGIVAGYLLTTGSPADLLNYQTTVQITCSEVLTFQPIE